MAVHLINYATDNFLKYQAELNESARKYGINSIFSYTQQDLINTEFYEQNKEILMLARGAGFWLWKPYFILKTLYQLNNDDILIYADSGSLFLDSPEVLIDICRKNQTGIVAFDAYPLTNSQMTKRDTFINMNCDDSSYASAPHVIATVILFKKTEFVLKFVEEWLGFCKVRSSITDEENINGKPNYPDYVLHQGDQPIFSLLIKKYNIETYRNPSKWGNFLKLTEFRVKKELVCYPYYVKKIKMGYSKNPYKNSPYGTIFEFNRARVVPKRTIWQKIKSRLMNPLLILELDLKL